MESLLNERSVWTSIWSHPCSDHQLRSPSSSSSKISKLLVAVTGLTKEPQCVPSLTLWRDRQRQPYPIECITQKIASLTTKEHWQPTVELSTIYWKIVQLIMTLQKPKLTSWTINSPRICDHSLLEDRLGDSTNMWTGLWIIKSQGYLHRGITTLDSLPYEDFLGRQ